MKYLSSAAILISLMANQSIASEKTPSPPIKVNSTIYCIHQYGATECSPDFEKKSLILIANLAGPKNKKKIISDYNNDVEGLSIIFWNEKNAYNLLKINEDTLRKHPNCRYKLSAKISVSSVDYKSDEYGTRYDMQITINDAEILNPLHPLPKSEQLGQDCRL